MGRSRGKKKKKKTRVYMHGCFDMMHYGHCNALRQARSLGDELIVGIVSDAEIIAIKGRPPVSSHLERMIMVNAVKWVDDVIPDAPYAITKEFMEKLSSEYSIDYIIHGDDPCLLPDGTDAYALAREADRYKQIKRTEGVSSTDIVGRMLLRIRARSVGETSNLSTLQQQFSHGHSQKFENGGSGTGTRISHFLPASQRIVQLANGKAPGTDARIVYIDGAFDFFHAGHAEILRLARGLGDFLLVGIHSDLTVSDHRGAHRPILNLHDRSLSVLACRYVDGVILGAPRELSMRMILTLDITSVVHGTVAGSKDVKKVMCNPYAVSISMGRFQLIDSPLEITTSTMISKIVSHHETYQVLPGLKKSLQGDVDRLKSEFQPLKLFHQESQEDYTAKLHNLVGLGSWRKKLNTQVESLETYQDELLEFFKSLNMEANQLKLEYKDLTAHRQPEAKDLSEKLRKLEVKDVSEQAGMNVNKAEAPISEDGNMSPMRLLLLFREEEDLKAINHLIHDVSSSTGRDISVAPFRCRWDSILHMTLVCDYCCENHEIMPRWRFDAIVTDEFNFELISVLVEKLDLLLRFSGTEAHYFTANELKSLEPVGSRDTAKVELGSRVRDMIERRDPAAALRERIVYILDPSRERIDCRLMRRDFSIEERDARIDEHVRNIEKLLRWNRERWGWEVEYGSGS